MIVLCLISALAVMSVSPDIEQAMQQTVVQQKQYMLAFQEQKATGDASPARLGRDELSGHGHLRQAQKQLVYFTGETLKVLSDQFSAWLQDDRPAYRAAAAHLLGRSAQFTFEAELMPALAKLIDDEAIARLRFEDRPVPQSAAVMPSYPLSEAIGSPVSYDAKKAMERIFPRTFESYAAFDQWWSNQERRCESLWHWNYELRAVHGPVQRMRWVKLQSAKDLSPAHVLKIALLVDSRHAVAWEFDQAGIEGVTSKSYGHWSASLEGNEAPISSTDLGDWVLSHQLQEQLFRAVLGLEFWGLGYDELLPQRMRWVMQDRALEVLPRVVSRGDADRLAEISETLAQRSRRHGWSLVERVDLVHCDLLPSVEAERYLRQRIEAHPKLQRLAAELVGRGGWEQSQALVLASYRSTPDAQGRAAIIKSVGDEGVTGADFLAELLVSESLMEKDDEPVLYEFLRTARRISHDPVVSEEVWRSSRIDNRAYKGGPTPERKAERDRHNEEAMKIKTHLIEQLRAKFQALGR